MKFPIPTQITALTAAVPDPDPDPDPEPYAMMLAGLGLVGFMAKRRKSKQA